MKNSNRNFINLLSYVALVIFALLTVIDIFAHFDILHIQGGVILNLLNTIKHVCILIVIGFAAYNFASGNKKWIRILFWISLVVILVWTILMWL